MTTPPNIIPARALSRRDFIARTSLAAAAALATPPLLEAQTARPRPPLVVFSKIYQELKLNYAQAAALTAEAALDGIDCPVRPGGEVLPERVQEDLPRYAEELRRHKLQLPFITTAITGPASAHAERILRTAKQLGVRFYRLGYFERQTAPPLEQQLREIQAQLKDLAALNREIGLGGVLHNHSPSGRTTYIGGHLDELRQLTDDLDPAQLGVVFDIGHALVVHGDDWASHFEKLKSRLKVAYIKDVRHDGRWLPFGEGDIARTDYFRRLKKAGYDAPLEIHIEFEWSNKGKAKDRSALLQALRDSARVTAGWWKNA